MTLCHKKTSLERVRPEYQSFLRNANAFIEEQNSSGIKLSPKNARIGLDALSVFSLPSVEISMVRNITVSADGTAIPVRVYDPCPEQVKPVVVYLHGGGHMCGSIELYDPICRRLAARTCQLVVAIDYRLAPEFPYPCGLEDCQFVVDHLERVLSEYLVDCTRLTLAGDSAGGALAATIAYQSPPSRILRLVLIYPSLDYTFSSTSYRKFAVGYLLETSRIQWYFDHYFKPDADRHKASPLYFPALEKMPDTLLIGAELDPLVEEGKQFHQRLRAAKVDSTYYENKGFIHCFLNLEQLNPEFIDEIYNTISTFINNIE